MLLGEVITFIDDPRAPTGPGTRKPAQLVDAQVVRVEPDAEALFKGGDGWDPGVDQGDLRWVEKPTGKGLVVEFSTILLPAVEQQALAEGDEREAGDVQLADEGDHADDGIANPNRHTVPVGFQRETTREVVIELGRPYAIEVVERKSRHTLPARLSRSKAVVGKKAEVERAAAEQQKGLFG